VQTIIDAAKDMESTLLADRRHLHANPEIGHDLPGTVAYLTERLTQI
jgi:hippurate hydrolase